MGNLKHKGFSRVSQFLYRAKLKKKTHTHTKKTNKKNKTNKKKPSPTAGKIYVCVLYMCIYKA